jgi:hypothetical protein
MSLGFIFERMDDLEAAAESARVGGEAQQNGL